MLERLSRWWSTISLRTKITGVTVFLLAMGLTVAGAGTLSVVSSYLIDQVDVQLQEAANDLPPYLQLDGENTFSDDRSSRQYPYYLAAVDYNGQLLADNLPEAERNNAPEVSDLTLLYLSNHLDSFTLTNEKHTAEWRVIAMPLRMGVSGQATLLVGTDLSATKALISQYS